jgi:hypothetical protein
MTREEFLAELRDRSKGYGKAASVQEWSYWIGASLAATCSGVAAVSIVADLGAWNQPYGRVITGALAIVPAIWAGIDRVLGLRRLSVFNYGVSSKLSALYYKASSTGLDDDTKKLIGEYNNIMAGEDADFATLMNGTGRSDAAEAQVDKAKAMAEAKKINDKAPT